MLGWVALNELECGLIIPDRAAANINVTGGPRWMGRPFSQAYSTSVGYCFNCLLRFSQHHDEAHALDIHDVHGLVPARIAQIRVGGFHLRPTGFL